MERGRRSTDTTGHPCGGRGKLGRRGWRGTETGAGGGEENTTQYGLVDDRRRFLLLEKYVDRAAFDAHRATEHFTEVAVKQIRPLLDDRSVEILDA